MRLTRVQLLLPLAICLLCQAMYRAFSVRALTYTAREAFFGGLCGAAVGILLVLLCLRLGNAFAQRSSCCACKNVARALLCLCLLLCAGQTAVWQLRFYQQLFGEGGWWVLLFCAATVCLHVTPHALVRCARLLCVFCVAGAVCAVLGLMGQSDVQRLTVESLSAGGFWAAFWVQLFCLPDYLLLLAYPACRTRVSPSETITKEPQNTAKFLLLPLLAFGVQFFAVLFTELLFGVQQAGVGGFEFLRSWALLNLSRYDGIIALLWLLLAFYRLRVFAFAAQQCAPFASVAKKTAEQEAVG